MRVVKTNWASHDLNWRYVEVSLKNQSIYRWLFFAMVFVILLSPLAYWSAGIGQSAAGLSAEVGWGPDGTLLSSPKAEALHHLSLPMRIERLLIYPLLLIFFQFSGGPLALRRWLEGKVRRARDWGQAPGLPLRQAQSLILRVAQVLGWIGRLAPRAWRGRVTGRDLLAILLFVLILDLAVSLLYLLFNFYSSFILAHQFDLSTQTAPGWASDWVKNLLVSLVIDGLVWTGFYALMRLLPRRWPLPTGALMILLSAVFVLIAPIVITPLFYEVRPLEDPAMRTRILSLADRAGMNVDEVYVINASTKTTAVNAYFTGFGGAQRIVFYDTMLTGYTSDEVEVVLAHEMGHWYYHHVLLGLLGMGSAGWIGLFGLRWLLRRTWRWLGLSGPADVAGLPYVMAVVAIATTLALPVQNSVARYGERQADHFSLVVSQRPEAFIELFEKIAVQNLTVVDVSDWEKYVFYTHPSIVERVAMGEAFQEE